MRKLFILALLSAVVLTKRDTTKTGKKMARRLNEDTRNLDSDSDSSDSDSSDDEDGSITRISPRMDESSKFLKYVAENNKHYENAEEFTLRNECWRKSHKKVERLNRNNKYRGVTFGDNFTSDMMDEEFADMLGLDTVDLSGGEVDEEFTIDSSEVDTEEGRRRLQQAAKVDWVAAGKMGPVKSQGRCGACWSFSATSVLESMMAIKTGNDIVRLSEQEGVDCTTNTQANFDKLGKVYGTYGCYGGWMARYWNFSRDHGSMSNEDYPYVDFSFKRGDKTHECAHDDEKIVARAGESGQITTSIGAAVVKLQDGPLTMAVSAGNDCWRYYKSGILTSAHGCPTGLNHAAVAVGVGLEHAEVPATEETSKKTCRLASSYERRKKKCYRRDNEEFSKRVCCQTIVTPGTEAYAETMMYWRL